MLKSCKAVILAGGLGTRLHPFTQVIPKPLLPIGESSVLELQILSLKRFGVTDIIIATNHMSDYVKAFLGDGSRYQVKITFSQEEKPLGTCGPLSLVRSLLTEPFFMLNGDILTTLDFAAFHEAGMKTDANLIVATKELITPFQFGKILSENGYITGVEEKPDLKLEILAGIYMLKPAALEFIPDNEYFGIDSLIKTMLAKHLKVGKHLIKEYWLDIGRINDYETAQNAYKQHFAELKK
ncbi:MAG: NTP transferase domain-containing protein [Verrucomicrobia bacterium]|nr:NTP transferase domain-containing protein [Verrucomicrobiota bacterium]